MTSKPDLPQDHSLRNLRLFLLVCFLAVSACCGVIAVAPLFLFLPPGSRPVIRVFNIPLPDTGLPLPTLAILIIIFLAGLIGGALVGVYLIAKARMQQEAESDPEGEDYDEATD